MVVLTLYYIVYGANEWVENQISVFKLFEIGVDPEPGVPISSEAGQAELCRGLFAERGPSLAGRSSLLLPKGRWYVNFVKMILIYFVPNVLSGKGAIFGCERRFLKYKPFLPYVDFVLELNWLQFIDFQCSIDGLFALLTAFLSFL